MSCEHIGEAEDRERPFTEGCPGCVTQGFTDWVHLRECLTCGYIGCCDSSPRRHATGHFLTEKHPVMRSVEPGESWRWCFVDETVG